MTIEAADPWLIAAELWDAGTNTESWAKAARPDQLAPDGDGWDVWLILAGRGFGKTRSMMEDAAEQGRRFPGSRIALVAATRADARDTLVEGEALAIDTLVPTPTGTTTMGQLQAGDVIIGGDGRPCTVTTAFAVLHDRPCYTVRFKGGAEITADANHKWLTEDAITRAYQRRHGSTKRKPEVRTTAEIAATLRSYGGSIYQSNHCIRVTEPHYSGRSALPIDPYTLGAWLGDGTAKSGAITTADPEMLKEFEAAGYQTRLQPGATGQGCARTYGILGLQAQLRTAGLLRNKHIPVSYLRADRDTRLALLQGLMDTDGYVSERGQCEFVNKNRRLAEELVDLAAGLGIKVSAPRSKLTRIGTTHWLVKFMTTQLVFRLTRKLDRLPERYRDADYWRIIDVEPAESVPVRCIAVDSPDHTFLVTRQHIRTHNSGLLACLEPHELRYGTVDGAWNRSLGELFMANGTRFKCYSSEKPRQLRGPQQHFTYADEIAQWNDAKLGAIRDTTWSNLIIGTRLPARAGWPDDYRPRIVAATTPKQVALLRSRDPANPGLLETETVAITRGRTTDNLANLSETYRRQVVDPLLGTRLGTQELDGVLLEDVEGALFTSEQIEGDRIRFGDVPALAETVVAVDPSTTGGESSDECGIIGGGRGMDGHGYTLVDDSLRGSPLVWAVQAWRTAFNIEAEALVVEDNQGGEMCEVTLLAAWPQVAPMYAQAGRIRPAIRRIHAVASKRARAVPIALMAERHQLHNVLDVGSGANGLLLLEGELTGWDGTGDSPNRLDGYVHLWRWLYRIGVKDTRVVVGQRWAGGRQ